MTNSKTDIFISYSKKDHATAYQIADGLTRAGFDVWIDRSLEVGDEWEEVIKENLYRAKDVIVILSKNALVSRWVMHEGSMAYAWEKNIFPLLIEEIPPSDLPIWCKKIQYHTFYGVELDEAQQKLIEKLTPVNKLNKLLKQQFDICSQTDVLPGLTFLQSVEKELGQDPIQGKELASFLLLAALRNNLHVDFWVELALQNDVDVFYLLQDSLREEEYQIRKSAVQALRLITKEEHIEILLDFLKDPYPQVRKETVLALWCIPEAKSRLMNHLQYECYIPAGIFIMGVDELLLSHEHNLALSEFDKERFSEYPDHEVFLDDYLIDTYPVTNSDYARYLLDTKPEAIKTENFLSVIEGQEHLSVTNLDWDEAYEYARWAGKRLPTEAEWEKAARGPQSYLFPWGNRFDPSKAHTQEGQKISRLKPVDSYSPHGDSAYGVANLVGNVWEWVYDWYQENYYRSQEEFRQPTGPDHGKYKTLRGGSIKETMHYANNFRRIGRLPLHKANVVGFRCAFDLREAK